jgi:hypothetical protein
VKTVFAEDATGALSKNKKKKGVMLIDKRDVGETR